jgi:hypothetical protein
LVEEEAASDRASLLDAVDLLQGHDGLGGSIGPGEVR